VSSGQSIYRRLFWPVYAPSILFGIAAGATIPVQVIAAMQLGASASQAALVVAVVGAVALATTVPAGALIDRLGDRRSMLFATLTVSLFTLLTIAALVRGPGSLWLFVLALVGRAPAANVWSLARQAFVADRVASHEVGRAMTALGGTMRAGNLVGPLLGGLLLLRLPLWSVFVLSVVCALLAVAVLYTPSLGGRLEASRTTASAVPRRGDGDQAGPLPVDWTRVVLAGVAILTLAVARVSQPVVLQLWGFHSGLSESVISLLVAVGAGIELVLMIPGGHFKDTLGRAPILVTCLLVYGSGFLLMVPLTGWLGLAGITLAVVVMAVGNGLGAGINMTIGADLSPAQGRGRFLGTWALFSNAGVLGGPLLLSAFVGLVSVAWAVASVGVLAVAGAGWVVLFARRLALPSGIGGKG